jgi:zinc D-Ala-D-Ala dipeptidase
MVALAAESLPVAWLTRVPQRAAAECSRRRLIGQGLRSLTLVVLLGAAAPSNALADPALPRGFVYLRDVDASILQDIRYAGSHNFVGRPINGYEAAECVLTERAARALKSVQTALVRHGAALIVWDCYRPARAVADFKGWTAQPREQRMKAEFYPNTPKQRLFALGYLASRSAHSRGSTVDLGLVPAGAKQVPSWKPGMPLVACTAPFGKRFDDGSIDLGTGYDCLDMRASFTHPGVDALARKNRTLLRDVMMRHGFRPYAREWWHFELRPEPFPHRIFDFPIRRRPRPGG